jgi:hypothetical protein
MGLERPRQRTAGDRLHHRRLDLEVASSGHEFANRGHEAAARFEDTPRIGIHDEIEVPLPVPNLDIGQTVPLLGQWQQTLREEGEARGPNGQLVGLRAEQSPLDAHPVPEIEQLEDLEVERRQRVLPDVDLDSCAAVGDGEKAGLPEGSNGQNAPGRDRLRTFGFELVMCSLAVGRHQIGNGVLPRERARIDLDAELRELLQIRPPLLNLFFLGGHLWLASKPRTVRFQISDLRFWLRHYLLPDPVQHPVDELDGILGAERARELEGLVDDDCRRRFRVAHQLADRHAQNEAIEHCHALGPPPLGRVRNQGIDRRQLTDRLLRQPRGKRPQIPGGRLGIGPLETEERIDGLGDLAPTNLVLVQDLKRGLPRAVPVGLVHAGFARRGRLMTGPLVRRAS